MFTYDNVFTASTGNILYTGVRIDGADLDITVNTSYHFDSILYRPSYNQYYPSYGNRMTSDSDYFVHSIQPDKSIYQGMRYNYNGFQGSNAITSMSESKAGVVDAIISGNFELKQSTDVVSVDFYASGASTLIDISAVNPLSVYSNGMVYYRASGANPGWYTKLTTFNVRVGSTYRIGGAGLPYAVDVGKNTTYPSSASSGYKDIVAESTDYRYNMYCVYD